VNAAALAARREALCVHLQAQRRLIAQRLAGEPAELASFPRSRTMQLLVRHPALAYGALARLVRLFRRKPVLR
jgi:hypothetical protein